MSPVELARSTPGQVVASMSKRRSMASLIARSASAMLRQLLPAASSQNFSVESSSVKPSVTDR